MVKGEIVLIKEKQQVSESFAKREFVVVVTESDPKYAQPILFETVQDKCKMLDDYAVGQEVEVHYNLRGRRWESPQGEIRYFNTLSCWKLVMLNDGEYRQDAMGQPEEDESDMPF